VSSGPTEYFRETTLNVARLKSLIGIPAESCSHSQDHSSGPHEEDQCRPVIVKATAQRETSATFGADGSSLCRELVARAVADTASPLHGIEPSAVLVNDGRMCQRDQPDIGETLAALLRRQSVPSVEALGTWNPVGFDTGYALMTFGAQFAEVAVDPDLGLVRVRRMVGAFAPGRVLNAKMASSQLMGGML
jgi:CO/xanthine dehydrogenase Mo-binding subunit